MQANGEDFGGQQGQLSTQVIRWVCHEGTGLQIRTTLRRDTQGQNCPGMTRAVESWRSVVLLHGKGRGWNGALAHGQDGGRSWRRSSKANRAC